MVTKNESVTTNEGDSRESAKDSEQPRTAYFSTRVRDLLSGNRLSDEGERRLVVDALHFIESPSDDFQEIKKHQEVIGELIAYAEVMGEKAPEELDAMHTRLLTLLFQHAYNASRLELAKPDCNVARAKHLAQCALDDALALKQLTTQVIAGKLISECREREIR